MKPFEEFHRDSAARDGRRPECKACNQGLGMFGEDAELLDAAARYPREGVTA